MPLVSRLCPLCGRCPPGANRALLRAPVTLGLGHVSAYGQRAGKAGRVGAGGRVPTPPCPGPPRNAPNGPEPQPCGQSPPHEDPALAPLLHRLASSLPAALSAVPSRINHAHAHLHLGVPSGGPQPITLSKHGDTSGRAAEPGRDGEKAASRAVPCVTSSAALPSPGRGQASHVTASARTREASSS